VYYISKYMLKEKSFKYINIVDGEKYINIETAFKYINIETASHLSISI